MKSYYMNKSLNILINTYCIKSEIKWFWDIMIDPPKKTREIELYMQDSLCILYTKIFWLWQTMRIFFFFEIFKTLLLYSCCCSLFCASPMETTNGRNSYFFYKQQFFSFCNIRFCSLFFFLQTKIVCINVCVCVVNTNFD